MLTEIGGMMMAPDNVYDLTWLFFSTVSVFLMTAICIIVWWWAKEVCKDVKGLRKDLAKLYTSEQINEVNISTHIENNDVHCKGMECLCLKGSNI
jgi:hypothetical protein